MLYLDTTEHKCRVQDHLYAVQFRRDDLVLVKTFYPANGLNGPSSMTI
jgi:hypothetical protein